MCKEADSGKWSPERTNHSKSMSISIQPKSAMIEQEKAAIERIKLKQQKEIEKMLG